MRGAGPPGPVAQAPTGAQGPLPAGTARSGRGATGQPGHADADTEPGRGPVSRPPVAEHLAGLRCGECRAAGTQKDEWAPCGPPAPCPASCARHPAGAGMKPRAETDAGPAAGVCRLTGARAPLAGGTRLPGQSPSSSSETRRPPWRQQWAPASCAPPPGRSCRPHCGKVPASDTPGPRAVPRLPLLTRGPGVGAERHRDAETAA